MKYFAKYIVVEGPITAGCMALKPAFEYEVYPGHQGTHPPYMEEVTQFELETEKPEQLSQYKLVRLHLCEWPPVQIGDEVEEISFPYSKGIVKEIVKGGGIRLSDGKWDAAFNSNYYYPTNPKVVGEISKEAVWVREGDSFQEDEFKLVLSYSPKQDIDLLSAGDEYFPTWEYKNGPINGELEVEHNYYGDILVMDLKADQVNEIRTCRILNQSCKHFH